MDESGIAADWEALDAVKYRDEAVSLARLAEALAPYDAVADAVGRQAAAWVTRLRQSGAHASGLVGGLLARIDLASPQGLALVRLCEAYGRAQTAEEQDGLIQEQVAAVDWRGFAADDPGLSAIVLALTSASHLTGGGVLARLGGAAATRAATGAAIKALASEFILGDALAAALRQAQRQGWLCSFDMLGEGARSDADAERYEARYAAAIERLAAAGGAAQGHSVSVKLSALDCAYEATKPARAFEKLYPRLERLMRLAAAQGLGLTVDAEESDRLVLSLRLIEALAEAAPPGWAGLGLAVQAYQRRALDLVERLIAWTHRRARPLTVRLVKGAYWNAEIKAAQLAGRPSYPVFTSKAATDLSFLACATRLLEARPLIHPAFATHNAHSLAAVLALAERCGDGPFELQRLHGMGEGVFGLLDPAIPVRVYAPVGDATELLPYLVRRLLENGAGGSFVQQLRRPEIAATQATADPRRILPVERFQPRLPDPPVLFGARRQAVGRDLSIAAERQGIAAALTTQIQRPGRATGIIAGRDQAGAARDRRAPFDPDLVIGTVLAAESAGLSAPIDAAFTAATAAFPAWNAAGGAARAAVLRRMAAGLEGSADALIAAVIVEAGKTWPDAVAELREAVDFCRYYADLAEAQFGPPQRLPGFAGEETRYSLSGRGVFICISPWNFPLAIFTGQIAAALAAGNAVIAKPAEQTPLVAAQATRIFLDAGVPPGALALILGGRDAGARLVADPRGQGIAFTGGTLAARRIQAALLERPGPPPRLIAETGGLNALFADHTAVPEQLIDDVLTSAFGAAGQRCSSARLLAIPEDMRPGLVERLAASAARLTLGDPRDPAVDVGPLIDAAALAQVQAHVARLENLGRRVRRLGVVPSVGSFHPLTLIELASLEELTEEVFGPVLHVIGYRPGAAETLARALAAKGYALTLGIHTRLRRFEQTIRAAVPAGNVYVNRSMIGAVVGAQPFGGFGWSGTGPKAGGPLSLTGYAVELCVTDNIAARGEDIHLLNAAMDDTIDH